MQPEVGLHQDVPEAVYHSWDAAGSSHLKLVGRSLAHARYEQLHPKEQTRAQALGSAIHRAVLEPDRFEWEYCATAQCDRRTKEGKARWAAFVGKNAGKEILEGDDYATCLAMRDAVWANPHAAEILKGPGLIEASAAWIDPETGLLCKGRMDRLAEHGSWSWIWDVKSTEDASPSGFAKAVSKWDYHCQAAHYLDGLNVLAPRKRRFGFIAVEKKPPYCVALYELEEEDLEMGRYDNEQRLAALKQAVESGNWPGYSTEIEPLGLPGWRRKAYEYGD